MKISVIIPTYNRREVLARTLESLFAQDFPGDEYEVIVAVDGSTDGTVESLRRLRSPCPLRFVEHRRNLGQSAARNSALSIARGDLILCIDDDIICSPNLLSAHAAAHEGESHRVVLGSISVAPQSPQTLATDRMCRMFASCEPNAPLVKTDWINTQGGNLSAPRLLVIAAGGFDTGMFRMFEDTELAVRLWKLGAAFYYHPGAAVSTLYVKTYRDLIEDSVWAGRNYVRLSRKHPEFRRYVKLGTLSEDGVGRRTARAMYTRLPVSPAALLRFPCWIAQRWRGLARVRNAGIRLLDYHMTVVAFRSALREAGSWQALRREFAMRLPVLAYRASRPVRPANDHCPTVAAQGFERQVRWLARRGYAGVRPSDWLAWLCEGKQLPSKPVLITFDGSDADLLEPALATLRRYGFGAAVYIPTGSVPGAGVRPGLKAREMAPAMSAERISYWAEQGIEFGAQGRSNRDLTIMGREKIREEVFGARQDLERLLPGRQVSFAYPRGTYNDAVREYVKQAYQLAVTQQAGINSLRTERELLKRTSVDPATSLSGLEFVVRFGWNPFARAVPPGATTLDYGPQTSVSNSRCGVLDTD
jgi:glycosyltransferase involved in cell wall biosynthesis/peptidoglycan/xylan/chitin deacetylase (PgdA/CDA1 family)